MVLDISLVLVDKYWFSSFNIESNKSLYAWYFFFDIWIRPCIMENNQQGLSSIDTNSESSYQLWSTNKCKWSKNDRITDWMSKLNIWWLQTYWI